MPGNGLKYRNMNDGEFRVAVGFALESITRALDKNDAILERIEKRLNEQDNAIAVVKASLATNKVAARSQWKFWGTVIAAFLASITAVVIALVS